MEPDHPIIIGRLAGIFLCGLPAVRELYHYINDPRFDAHLADTKDARLITVNLICSGERSGWDNTRGSCWQPSAPSFWRFGSGVEACSRSRSHSTLNLDGLSVLFS